MSNCAHNNLISTTEDSQVCADCGLVVEATNISFEQEWNTYNGAVNNLDDLKLNESKIRCDSKASDCLGTNNSNNYVQKSDSKFYTNLKFFTEANFNFFESIKNNLILLHEKVVEKLKIYKNALNKTEQYVKKINFNKIEYVMSLVVFYWTKITHMSFPISYFKNIFPSYNRRLVFGIVKQLKQLKIFVKINKTEYTRPQIILLKFKINEFFRESSSALDSKNIQLVDEKAATYLKLIQNKNKIILSRKIDTQINLAMFLSLIDYNLLTDDKSKFFKNKLNTIVDILKTSNFDFLSDQIKKYLALNFSFFF